MENQTLIVSGTRPSRSSLSISSLCWSYPLTDGLSATPRACFKKLPRILSFNTMRYTFNMVTMMKEKVNTHFSFPLRLNMTTYTEDFLMGKGDRKEGGSRRVT